MGTVVGSWRCLNNVGTARSCKKVHLKSCHYLPIKAPLSGSLLCTGMKTQQMVKSWVHIVA